MSEQKDQAGTIYNSPTDKPATTGTPITIPTNNGTVPGHMVDGEAVADRK